jgi:hypothetical protein
MSDLKVQGKLVKLLDKVTGNKKDGSGTWVKQSFVINNGEQFNNLQAFEVFGDDKVENLNKFNKIGDEVTVSFNISCNEWQGKYYTSLSAWRIELLEDDNDVEVPDLLVPPSRKITAEQLEEDADDLPF